MTQELQKKKKKKKDCESSNTMQSILSWKYKCVGVIDQTGNPSSANSLVRSSFKGKGEGEEEEKLKEKKSKNKKMMKRNTTFMSKNQTKYF